MGVAAHQTVGIAELKLVPTSRGQKAHRANQRKKVGPPKRPLRSRLWGHGRRT